MCIWALSLHWVLLINLKLLRCLALRCFACKRSVACVALCCVACKWSVALQFLNGSMGCSLHSEKQSLTCPPRSRDRKLMQF